MTYSTKKLGELIASVIKTLVFLFQKKTNNPVKVDEPKEQKLPIEIKEPPIEIKEPVVIETKNIEQEVKKDFVLEFIKGDAHLADNPIVKKIREIIRDEFNLGKLGECLNCTEYVQFRVKQKLGIDIKWPSDRPRHGGKWASVFERNNLYKILDLPKINCAVSFTTGISNNPEINEVGHVAFVEKINDDESIEISEVNWPNQGKYNERRLEKLQWKDKYKCRFIDFN